MIEACIGAGKCMHKNDSSHFLQSVSHPQYSCSDEEINVYASDEELHSLVIYRETELKRTSVIKKICNKTFKLVITSSYNMRTQEIEIRIEYLLVILTVNYYGRLS